MTDMHSGDATPFALEATEAPSALPRGTAVHVRSGDWLAVSYGGGNNSWAGLLELADRGYKPNFIGMADTKGEKPKTYSHLYEVAMPWVKKTWGMEIAIVKKLYRGEWEGLEGQCLRHNQMPSLAYGHRSCSQKYKHEMLERALAAAMRAAGVSHAVKAIFYHAMEQYRVGRAPLEKEIKAGLRETYWYPLIEWNIRGEDCAAIGKRHGLPMPGKSACFFCPATKPSEVMAMRDNAPELLTRALEIERRAQTTNRTKRGLGGANHLWADWLKMDAEQLRLLPDINPVDIPCGCFDGDDACSSPNQ